MTMVSCSVCDCEDTRRNYPGKYTFHRFPSNPLLREKWLSVIRRVGWTQIRTPLGLLTLTGVLWGCTNPFIRRGTRGLRDVKANTLSGQAWAEVSFLLTNWRYVVPWLVNQAGSLVYLLGVQRAPLSLAVPVANGLAFACTALAGALTGLEEPLHRGSILGIALIVAGTALCCFDNTS